MNFWQNAFLIGLLFLPTVFYSAGKNDDSQHTLPLKTEPYIGYLQGSSYADSLLNFWHEGPLAGIRKIDSVPALPTYNQDKGLQEPYLRSSRSYHLLKTGERGRPGPSGDRQHVKAGGVADPLRVKVVNQDFEPVIGIPVLFEVVDYPRGGRDYLIDRKMVPTDSSGMAVANMRLGTARGEYQVIARIRSSEEENVKLFILFARDRNWPFLMLMGIVGGLVLFLLGMEIAGNGMVRLAGYRTRNVLGNPSGSRFKAIGLGTFISAVNPGSNVVNLMPVSLVNFNLLGFRQTPGIILGAGIGAAIITQVIAFQVTGFLFLLLAGGFVIRFFPGSRHFKNAGDVLLGLGILFFGMTLMSESLYPLRSFEPFFQVLSKLGNPVAGIAAGTVLTVLAGSSPAFAGILIVFGMQGLIGTQTSILLIIGAVTGVMVTPLLAAINKSTNARMVALVMVLFKISGVLILVWFIEPFATFIEHILPVSEGKDEMAMLAEVMPRRIAHAFTLYNLFIALLFLPFTGVTARLAERLVPGMKTAGKGKTEREPDPYDERKLKTGDKKSGDKKMKAGDERKKGYNKHVFREGGYLERSMLGFPFLALSLAKHETLRMGWLVRDMVSLVLPAVEKDPSACEDVEQMGNKVSLTGERISRYLLKISRIGISETGAEECFRILYLTGELAEIARDINALVQKENVSRETAGNNLSEEQRQELYYYNEKIGEFLNLAFKVIRVSDIKKLPGIKKQYSQYVNGYRDSGKYGDSGFFKQETTFLLRNILLRAAGIARFLIFATAGKQDKSEYIEK